MTITAERGTSNDTNSTVTNQWQKFVQSLTDALGELSAVEVNTMVVDEITPNKFIPWEVYRDIYPISKQYLDGQGIHRSLRSQYLRLREQLEIEYCLYLQEKDPGILSDSRILTDPNVTLDRLQTKLPNPLNPGIGSQEIQKINQILHDGRLLRVLRKLGELKIALDRRNAILNSSTNPALDANIVCVQTTTQIDGKITNRVHQDFVNHQHRDSIFQLHQQAVVMGDRQWQGLVEFTVNLLQLMSGEKLNRPQ